MKKEDISRIDMATAMYADNHMIKIIKYRELEVLEKISACIFNVEKTLKDISHNFVKRSIKWTL